MITGSQVRTERVELNRLFLQFCMLMNKWKKLQLYRMCFETLQLSQSHFQTSSGFTANFSQFCAITSCELRVSYSHSKADTFPRVIFVSSLTKFYEKLVPGYLVSVDQKILREICKWQSNLYDANKKDLEALQLEYAMEIWSCSRRRPAPRNVEFSQVNSKRQQQ